MKKNKIAVPESTKHQDPPHLSGALALMLTYVGLVIGLAQLGRPMMTLAGAVWLLLTIAATYQISSDIGRAA